MGLPVQVFRTGDPVDAVWRVAAAVSAFAAVIVLYLFPAVAHEYDARLARDAARMPTEILPDEAGRAASGAIGYWGVREDEVDGRPVSVVVLLPLGQPAVSPPGVSSWPGPDEVLASPEVLATPGGSELVARHGTLAGVIDPAVLADPRERILYVGVNADHLDPPPYWLPVSGFGVPVDPARGDTGMLGSAQYQSPRSAAFILLVGFGLAPMLVLVAVLGRLGGERRDATVALLVALGARRRDVRHALWRVARAPIAVGTLSAVLVAVVLDRLTWRVPVTGYVMTPSPDVAQALALAVCAVLGALLTWGALWVGTRPRRATVVSARPEPPQRPTSVRPVLGLLVTLLVVNWLYAFINPANPTVAAAVLFVGLLVCILLLGPATASILAALARGIVAASRRGSRPTAGVVGRELTSMAPSAVRATVFMGVVALTATFVTVLATQPSELLRHAQAASALDGGRSVAFETGDDADWLPGLAAALPADHHLVQVVQGLPAGGGLRLAAPCPTQHALLGSCADDGPAPLRSITQDVPVQLRVWGASESTPMTTATVGPGQVLVVRTGGLPVDRQALAAAMRDVVSPTPVLAGPGASWIVGAAVAVSQARWIVVVGALACLLAATMGCATLMAELVRMRRRHRVFAVYAGGFHRHLALGGGLVGVPLVLGGLIGGTTGFLASYSAIRLGTASLGSAGALVTALIALALTVAAAASVAAAVMTASSASGRAALR